MEVGKTVGSSGTLRWTPPRCSFLRITGSCQPSSTRNFKKKEGRDGGGGGGGYSHADARFSDVLIKVCTTVVLEFGYVIQS